MQTDAYPTREAAMQAAMAQVLEAGEAAMILTCTCGRQDMHDMPHVRRSAIMEACAGCEKMIIGEAGNA